MRCSKFCNYPQALLSLQTPQRLVVSSLWSKQLDASLLEAASYRSQKREDLPNTAFSKVSSESALVQGKISGSLLRTVL